MVQRCGHIWSKTGKIKKVAQRKLRMMISSRSDAFSIPDGAGGKMPLRDVRKKLKAELEAEEFFGTGLLEVWINEREHGDYDQTAWEECLQQAADCDLFVCLYDGSAGWAETGGAVGICQAEFDTALRLAPGKVKIVRLPGNKLNESNKRDLSFLEALTKASRFETQIKKDWPELLAKISELTREMLLKAAHEGVREYRKSGANVGQALDWSRMTFGERSEAIATTIAGALEHRNAERVHPDGARVVAKFGESEILFHCHGAPRSLSVAAAREFVGQPFLRDHLWFDGVSADVVGPVHLIGCPKGTTETQAVNLLGFPDFTVVEGAFGVYAADTIQRIQLCLLADCGDPGSTRNAVDRFFEWLERSQEMPRLVSRAMARRKIIDAIMSAD